MLLLGLVLASNRQHKTKTIYPGGEAGLRSVSDSFSDYRTYTICVVFLETEKDTRENTFLDKSEIGLSHICRAFAQTKLRVLGMIF